MDTHRDAHITHHASTATLRFERALNHPPEKVWQALTTPEIIAKWFQADADIDPRQGGKYHLEFQGRGHGMHGQITTWNPPHTLAYTWPEPEAGGDSTVTWHLTPTETGTLLVLTHHLRAGGNLADFASGWHWHLDALDHALLGETVLFDHAQWSTLQDRYASGG
jgi:uncharacterized protein YndB with AHSA1/START domain